MTEQVVTGLTNQIYVQTGDTAPHELPQPADGVVSVCHLWVQSGSFEVKPGDYVPRTFASATDIDTGTDIITKVAHGFETGDGPYLMSTSSALPAPVLVTTLLWVERVTADTFRLHTTRASAMLGPNGSARVNFTSAGTGTQSIPAATFPPSGTANTNGYGSLKLQASNPEQSKIDIPAPGKVTVKGGANGDVLVYWWK